MADSLRGAVDRLLAQVGRLTQKLKTVERNALVSENRADVASKAPASAAYLFPQGVTIDTSIFPAGQNIQAGTGISIAGNVITNAGGVIPGLHASTHAAGGSDPVTLTEAQITNLTADLAAKVPTSRNINTTAPITGGGDLSADRTIALTTSPTGQTPVGVTRAINTTAPVTGGGDLSADRTIAVSVFVASGASHASGLVPDPGASGGTVKYLREDATFTVPVGTWIKRTAYITNASSQTHTPDSKCKSMFVRAVGPGGAGGGAVAATNNAGVGGGGSAGAYGEIFFSGVSGTYTYTVGTGGTAGTAGANPGNDGTNATSFSGTGCTLSCPVGKGGQGMASGTGALAVAGGTTSSAATGGNLNSQGAPGGAGLRFSGTVAVAGQGGPSVFGGGAVGRVSTNGAGVGATSPGSGGSGACAINNSNSLAGGAGADGCIIVDEFS